MRIGEQLLKAGLIDWETLALAVTDQPGTRQRLVSLLIDQGTLSFDDASRALGEQHGTSAVLERHLAHRDRDVAGLLPGAIAKARVAIPIGRLGNGTLIVCVRDPSDALRAALAKAIGEDIVLAVCPASPLERLVIATYATEQVAVLADADLVEDEPEVDVPIEVEEPPPPPELELDIDVQPARMANRALPVAIKRLATAPPSKDSLDAALGACKTVDEPGWLFDVVMPYLESKWTSSLVLELRDTRAVGIRGHGKRLKPSAVKTFVVTIEDAALVKLARDEKRIVDEPPADLGSEHEELATALEIEAPLAAGLGGKDVRHVLLLGAPIGQEREDALVDLGLLFEAMTDALSRM